MSIHCFFFSSQKQCPLPSTHRINTLCEYCPWIHKINLCENSSLLLDRFCRKLWCFLNPLFRQEQNTKGWPQQPPSMPSTEVTPLSTGQAHVSSKMLLQGPQCCYLQKQMRVLIHQIQFTANLRSWTLIAPVYEAFYRPASWSRLDIACTYQLVW